jgi:hypothetical protein
MTDPRITDEELREQVASLIETRPARLVVDALENLITEAVGQAEQAVIERLAEEAENDFEESTMDAAYEVLYKGGCSPVLETVLGVLRLGAAAGVAAERARIIRFLREPRDSADVNLSLAIAADLIERGGSDAA